MAIQTVDNKYGVAKWIVDPVLGRGTHTTIAAALTSASSGEDIFIRPGTYTENLTLKAGVNLTGFTCDEGGVSAVNNAAHVIIKGKMTATFTGAVVISALSLQTNADFMIATSGANSTVINCINCFLNAFDNSAFQLASSGAGSTLFIDNCWANLATAATNYFACTNGSSIFINNSQLLNGAASTTANTVANAGSCDIFASDFLSPITTSNTASFSASYSVMQTTNTTALTINGTGSCNLFFSRIESGTASAISIGAGATLPIHSCSITSSNTNAITGAGTVTYSDIVLPSSSEINTTTQTTHYDQLGKYRAMGQPAFLAYLGSNDNNATGDGTLYTLGATTALTEVFDQDNNFNTNGTFTAPVTGRYTLEYQIFGGGGSVITGANSTLTTSNRTYFSYQSGVVGSATTTFISNVSNLADMDAADTATVTEQATDTGGKILDISGLGGPLLTWYGGSLTC